MNFVILLFFLFIGIGIGGGIVYLALGWKDFFGKWKLISYTRLGNDYLVTVSNGKKQFQVCGNVTIWHEYPSGKRLGTHFEQKMVEIYQIIKWEEDKNVYSVGFR